MPRPVWQVQVGWGQQVSGIIRFDISAFVVATPYSAITKALTSNVATLTFATAHSLVVGDTLGVENVDATFNGTYVVSAVPSSTSVSYALTASNVTSQGATGTAGLLATTDRFGSQWVNLFTGANDDCSTDSVSWSFTRGRNNTLAQMDAGTLDIEFSRPSQRNYWNPQNASSPLNANNYPGFVPMRPIKVTGYFGGSDWTVTNKALTSNIATITTSGTHSVTVGSYVYVQNVDNTFNGLYQVTAVTSTTISFALTGSDVASTAATGTLTGPLIRYPRYTGFLRSCKYDDQTGVAKVTAGDLMMVMSRVTPTDVDDYTAAIGAAGGDAQTTIDVTTLNAANATTSSVTGFRGLLKTA